MSLKFLVMIGAFVGSTLGSFVPALWGDSLFSYSSVLLSGVGGVIGVIIGVKLGTVLEN
ncbi:hypothetical protein BH09PAT1_BH09PAT1_0080 [soil metagenome]